MAAQPSERVATETSRIMPPGIASLGPLLASVGILLAGNGLQNTLISVRGNIEGFSPQTIGLFTTFYFIGFMVGCFLAPVVVRRVGHIRAFAVFAAVAATATASHAIFVFPVAWFALRFFAGICFVGLFTVIESWISEKSTNENRGQVFSVYRIISLLAITGGQGLLVLADPSTFVLFIAVSMLVTLALVPVALSTTNMPHAPKKVHIRISRLYRISPLGMVGAMIGGMALSTFWALGPLFVQSVGRSVDDVALFVTVAIIGGAVSQYPVGKLSDKIDRRYTIIGTCIAAALAASALAYAGYTSAPWIFVGAGLFGATVMPMYGLAVAHANDFASGDEFVEMSGGLILANAFGAAAGVPIAAAVVGIYGEWAAFAVVAVGVTTVALFGLYRMTKRATLAKDARPQFVGSAGVMPESKIATKLDPRSQAQTESDTPQAWER